MPNKRVNSRLKILNQNSNKLCLGSRIIMKNLDVDIIIRPQLQTLQDFNSTTMFFRNIKMKFRHKLKTLNVILYLIPV
jgi:hypothetical protein